MSWDDSDDDWEKADLKVSETSGKKDDADWSDEEGHNAPTEEEKKQEQLNAKRTAPQEKKEVVLTKLDLAIMAREEREREEAEEAKAAKEANKKALKSKLDDDKSMSMSALEQELADGDGGFHAADDDDFEWDGGRGDGGLAPLPQADAPKAPSIDPETEAEAAVVLERIVRKFEGKKAHLSLIKGLIKKATDNMSTDDAKDLSSFVSVIFNDKVKADRDKDKKKPKAKAAKKINVSAGKAQDKDDDYDDGYDGYY